MKQTMKQASWWSTFFWTVGTLTVATIAFMWSFGILDLSLSSADRFQLVNYILIHHWLSLVVYQAWAILVSELGERVMRLLLQKKETSAQVSNGESLK